VLPQNDFVRVISGKTLKFGGVLTFTKSLRVQGAGDAGQNRGAPLAWSGKGADQTGATAGYWRVVNGAGFNDVQAWRDATTGLITRIFVVPNAPETEEMYASLENGGAPPVARWSATPVMIGAREDPSIQEQATAQLERPLGPRRLYRIRRIAATECDDGSSYLQDVQCDYVQPFAQSDGTVMFMFTTSEAKTIEPSTIAVIDRTEYVTEPAVSPEVIVVEEPMVQPLSEPVLIEEPAQNLPAAAVGDNEFVAPAAGEVVVIPPEQHAILVHEDDLPVVIDEQRDPQTGQLELIEVKEGPSAGHADHSGAIVGENGAGQAPPPVIYVDEAQAPEPTEGAGPVDNQVVVIGERRYVRLSRHRRRPSRRHARRHSYRRATRSWLVPDFVTNFFRDPGSGKYVRRAWPKQQQQQQPRDPVTGKFVSRSRGIGNAWGPAIMPGRAEQLAPGTAGTGTKHRIAPGTNQRNFNGFVQGGGGGCASAGGMGAQPRPGQCWKAASTRGPVGFGVDVSRKKDWKWGNRETGITIGVLAAAALLGYVMYQRQLKKTAKAARTEVVTEEIDAAAAANRARDL
jgi:hypothetical protein